MYDTMKNFIQKLMADKRRRRHFGMAVCVLSLIVAAGVTWQLRITGITMSDVPCCGLEAHVHTPECLESRLICGFTEETETTGETIPPEPVLSCETAEHTHGEECRLVHQELICEASEHTHGDECYAIEWVSDCAEEHEHDENCPRKEVKTLTCTQEEHIHGEACYYIEEELICEAVEHTHGDGCYTTPAPPESHVHTEQCWENAYICGYDEEHQHTLACYSNPDADVETPSQWESTLPGLTGNRGADLAAVARSQVGYQESDDNFIVAEDGENRHGITRYGQWYGNPYGEWNAMFATFCLRYAGIEDIPGNSGCYAWTAELGQRGLLLSPVEHSPAPGDLVFFDRDGDGTADHVGIVIRADGPFFSAVEGGREDRVEVYAYNRDDADVFAFVSVEEPEAEPPEPTEETMEETTEETTPEELVPLALDVTMYVDGSFDQRAEWEIPMTITGVMPEGLCAMAYPIEFTTEGGETLWAFRVGVYHPDGTLWPSPQPLIVTMTLPQEAEEDARRVIYHIPSEGEAEEIAAETAGELLAFEITNGEIYAAVQPAEVPEEYTLTVQFYEDHTYGVPIEGAPDLTVTGLLPKNAVARAYPAEAEVPEAEVLWALHLAVFTEDGALFEPEQPLSATIQMPQFYAGENSTILTMYQMEEGKKIPTQRSENVITFEAARPGVYAAAAQAATLRGAVEAGETSYTLSGDETVTGGTILITGSFMLELDGHTLTASTDAPLFTLAPGGNLTVANGKQPEAEASAGDAAPGQRATLEGETLTYWVTNSAGAGATAESTTKYTVTASGGIKAGNYPVFQVDGGTVKLQSGMIYGGNNRAVRITGGTADLWGGYVCGFNQSGSGGAVEITGGEFHVSGGILAGNSASEGGAIYATGGNVEITGGAISGNYASSGRGGGIFTAGAQVNMNGGHLTNNVSITDGGGIMASGGSFKLSGNSHVTANHAGGNGGGIMSGGASVNVSSGYVCGNEADSGGGIHMDGGSLMLTGGHINNNTSSGASAWGGGGIYLGAGSTLTTGNVLITGNNAGGLGGGVAGRPGGSIRLYASSGAAIFDNEDGGSNPTYVAGDGTDQALCEDATFKANGHKDLFAAGEASVSGAMPGGGAAQWRGSADYQPKTVYKEESVQSGTLLGLTASPDGQAINWANTAAQVYVTGNQSQTHGGGILVAGTLTAGTAQNQEVPAQFTLGAKVSLLGTDGGALNLVGRNFEFELLDGEKTVVSTSAAQTDGNVPFTSFVGEYTAAGDYVYYLLEKTGTCTAPEESIILYDTDIRRITVTVVEVPEGSPRGGSFEITQVKVDKGDDLNGETWTTVQTIDTKQAAAQDADLSYYRLNLDTENTGFYNHVFAAGECTFGINASVQYKDAAGEAIALIADQFSFEVLDEDQQTVLYTVKNQADGVIKFRTETYTAEGNHTYYIRQKSDHADESIHTDTTLYKIVVKVRAQTVDQAVGDDKTYCFIDGVTLTADDTTLLNAAMTDQWVQNYTLELSKDGAKAPAFTTTQVASGECKFNITGEKELKNSDGGNFEQQGGEFTFQLLDSDKLTVLAEVQNQAGTTIGKFDFASYFDGNPFQKADTYTFFVKEKPGEDPDDGIVYDESLYKIDVEIAGKPVGDGTSLAIKHVTLTHTLGDTDTVILNQDLEGWNQDYTLNIEKHSTQGSTPAFSNKKYEAKLTLSADVQLLDPDENKVDLADKAYTFEIHNQWGKLLATATNDASGKITWENPISVNNAGINKFYVSQRHPEAVGEILYDSTVYRVELDMQILEGHLAFADVLVYDEDENELYNRDDNAYKGREFTLALPKDKIRGTSFTNQELTVTSITVVKEWDGPEKQPVEVALRRNSSPYQSVILSEANGWTHTWSDLPISDGTETYKYTVEETTPGYTVSYSYRGEDGKSLEQWLPVTAPNTTDQYVIISDGHVLSLPEQGGSNSLPAILHDEATDVDGTHYPHWYEVNHLPESAQLSYSGAYQAFNGYGRLGNAGYRIRVSANGDSLTTCENWSEQYSAISVEQDQIKISRYTQAEANTSDSKAKEWLYISFENGKFVPSVNPSPKPVYLYKRVVNTLPTGVTVTITNSAPPPPPPEYELPKTGGVGTTGFIFLGTLLMAGAPGIWIYLQKRNREEGRSL